MAKREYVLHAKARDEFWQGAQYLEGGAGLGGQSFDFGGNIGQAASNMQYTPSYTVSSAVQPAISYSGNDLAKLVTGKNLG